MGSLGLGRQRPMLLDAIKVPEATNDIPALPLVGSRLEGRVQCCGRFFNPNHNLGIRGKSWGPDSAVHTLIRMTSLLKHYIWFTQTHGTSDEMTSGQPVFEVPSVRCCRELVLVCGPSLYGAGHKLAVVIMR